MFKQSSSNAWKGWGIVFLILALLPLFLGFNKLLVYNNSTYRSVNAYVGGDAYNYIINGNYATAYFVLTGILVMAAIGCGIMWNFCEIRNGLYEIEIPESTLKASEQVDRIKDDIQPEK